MTSPPTTYAVVQTDAQQPTLEQLRAAFAATPGLTSLDGAAAQHEFGILREKLSEKVAGSLADALVHAGVAARAINAAELVLQPRPRAIHRAQCTPEALTISDLFGNTQSVAWQHISLIGAGNVTSIQPHSELNWHTDVIGAAHGSTVTKTYAVAGHRDESVHQGVLVAFLGNEHAIEIDAMQFSYDYLRNQKTANREGNFRLVVEDFLRYAPHAMLNRGAIGIRGGEPLLREYRTREIFDREMIWLGWWMRQPGAAK